MKTLKIILSLTLSCLMFLSGNVILAANENSEFFVNTKDSLEFDNYVKSVFDKLLIAQFNLNNIDSIKLGQGIKVISPDSNTDYYIYPVIQNDDVIDTIHVSKNDGEFSSTYTHSLAEELNDIKSLTSYQNPMTLIKQKEYLYAQIGDTRTLLEYHSMPNLNLANESFEDLPNVFYSDLDTVNVYQNTFSNNVAMTPIPLAPVNVLSWTIYETQPSGKPWCASVTTTNIVRNTTSKYMTSASMRSYLNDQNGLTNNQVIFYLKNALNSPNLYGKNSGNFSYATVQGEINSGRAVYAGFEDGSNGHAIAIIGYNDYANVYYIHNPWYSYTETVTVGGTYQAGGYNWKWTGGGVYNIK